MPKLKKETEKDNKSKWVKPLVITFFSLILISLFIFIFAKQTILDSLRIVFGSVYVLFIPGFLISYIFFPKTKKFDEEESKNKEISKDKIISKDENQEKGAIDWIERIALSFALSIAIVPLCVFYLNLIGVKINLLNSFLTILGIILVSGTILYIKNKKKK